MKSFSIAAFALFVAWTTAAPMVKRDTIWFTVTEEVVETVEVVTTIWVAPGDLPPPTTTTSTSSTPAPLVFLPVPTPVAPASSFSTISTVPVVPAPSPVQPSSTSTSTTTTSTTTTSTTTTSTTTTSTTTTSTTTSTTPAYTPPTTPAPTSTSTTTPVPVAASTLATVQAAAPAPSPVAAAPAAPVAGGATTGTTPASGVAVGAPPAADGNSYEVATLSGASQADGCTPGTPCVGDMTFYNPSQGLGACGYGPNSYTYQDTDFVVAIAHDMMGSLSSGEVENPLCWRVLHITNPATGKSNTGMVVDKCAGCAGVMDIDLSPALYNTLGLTDVGRYQNVQWYWD